MFNPIGPYHGSYYSPQTLEILQQVLSVLPGIDTSLLLSSAVKMIMLNTLDGIESRLAKLKTDFAAVKKDRKKMSIELGHVYDYAKAMLPELKLKEDKISDLITLKAYKRQLEAKRLGYIGETAPHDLLVKISIVEYLLKHIPSVFDSLWCLTEKRDRAQAKLVDFEDDRTSLEQELQARDDVNVQRLLNMITDADFDVFAKNAVLVLVGCFPQLFEQIFPVNFPEHALGKLQARWCLPPVWCQTIFADVDAVRLATYKGIFCDFFNNLPFPKLIESAITHLLIVTDTAPNDVLEQRFYKQTQQACAADPANFLRLIQIWLIQLNDTINPVNTFAPVFFQGVAALNQLPGSFYKQTNGVVTTFTNPVTKPVDNNPTPAEGENRTIPCPDSLSSCC